MYISVNIKCFCTVITAHDRLLDLLPEFTCGWNQSTALKCLILDQQIHYYHPNT